MLQTAKIKKYGHYFYLWVLLLATACKNTKSEATVAEIEHGKLLFNSTGCASCHSFSEQQLYGPALNRNSLGSQIEVIRNDGIRMVRVDEAYIRRSIVDPDFEKAVSFTQQKMPKPKLTDLEINRIVAYVLSMYSQ